MYIYNYVAEKLHNKKIHRPQEFGLSRSGKSLWYFNPEQSKKLTYLFTREERHKLQSGGIRLQNSIFALYFTLKESHICESILYARP